MDKGKGLYKRSTNNRSYKDYCERSSLNDTPKDSSVSKIGVNSID
jgi:hypothetical protein